MNDRIYRCPRCTAIMIQETHRIDNPNGAIYKLFMVCRKCGERRDMKMNMIGGKSVRLNSN